MLARDCEAEWAEELHERMRSKTAAARARVIPDDRPQRRVVHNVRFVVHSFRITAAA